ncbi:MAG: hypothetical protein Kow0067_12620 [Coriobacteriia bacterium]|nr:hypothetical protein [Anaerosomatales bacterium]
MGLIRKSSAQVRAEKLMLDLEAQYERDKASPNRKTGGFEGTMTVPSDEDREYLRELFAILEAWKWDASLIDFDDHKVLFVSKDW